MDGVHGDQSGGWRINLQRRYFLIDWSVVVQQCCATEKNLMGVLGGRGSDVEG
jgi:hypothetical protein